MTKLPDFEAMTVEALEAWRLKKRRELDSLRAEIRASNEVYHRKVEEAREADLVRAMHLPEGTRIVVPPAELGLRGH